MIEQPGTVEREREREREREGGQAGNVCYDVLVSGFCASAMEVAEKLEGGATMILDYLGLIEEHMTVVQM